MELKYVQYDKIEIKVWHLLHVLQEDVYFIKVDPLPNK